jgi:ABC-type transport system substrate-binding protein
MRPCLLLAALVLVPAVAGAAPAKRVYAGVYLHDVTKFDQKDGVFDVDVELWAKWLGEFDPEALAIANAGEVEREKVKEENDGDWHAVRWRVRGTLRGEFPLHRFPFDAQTLAVVLELPERAGELVPDLASSGMRDRFGITGWLYEPQFRPRVTREVYHSDLGSIAGESQPTPVRRASFEVTVKRPPLMVALKLFLPLFIILLVAVIALFLAADEVEARSSIGVTALLSCFAFQFTVGDSLPSVTYMTLADLLFLLAYVITTAALVVSVLAYYLQKRGRETAALNLDRGARVVLLLGAIVPGIFVAREPPRPSPPEPPPRATPRPPTRKEVLRLGTTRISTLLAQPLTAGVYWGTVHKEPDGTRWPFLVPEAPGVDSDLLRFLASGELEVTWRLRAGLKWSDGTPLTARDLEFAVKLAPDSHVVDIQRPDERTLTLRYKEAVAQALEGFEPEPAHALEAIFDRGGYEEVKKHQRKQICPTVGPYRVASWEPDKRLVLEANPHFAAAPPVVKRIEINIYKDGGEIIRAFEAGEIDLATPNSTTPEETRAFQTRRPEAVRIRASNVHIFLNPDLGHKLLGKLAVRRALLSAIDRDALEQAIYGAEGAVSHVPVPGPLPKGARTWPYDPAAAKAALAREGAAGATIPFIVSGQPIDKLIAERVVADLKAVGVNLAVREEKDAAALYRKRSHGGILLYALRGDREVDPRTFWNVPRAGGHYDERARTDAYTDEVARLVEREMRALYPERRDQLRDLLFAAYTERLPNLPLLFASERVIADRSLAGWDHGTGARFGAGVERWAFPPAP